MSRAFVKDDAPDGPPIVPERAPLPPGAPNYVTPRGHRLLREEKESLESERSKVAGADVDDAESQRRLAVVTQQLTALTERLAIAQVVKPKSAEADTVRFGASVTVSVEGQGDSTVQIVGVDEASVEDGLVAFTSPIARAVIGKTVGERGVMQTPQGDVEVEVVAVSYES